MAPRLPNEVSTVSRRSDSFWVPILLLAGAVLAFGHGWKKLWFLTDDAFIAFRYVSNSQLGYGYVWNAPPFLPVEGYTSFLWVVLLDWTWSWLGVEPPASSNAIGFLFGVGSLALLSFMVLRMRLCDALRPLRMALVGIALLGAVTNFNFLMWASSGLETSLFNFLFLAWVASALYATPGSRTWLFLLGLTAGLLALTRPDGLLMTAATAVLIAAEYATSTPRPPASRLLFAGSLGLPAVHLLWRWSFYSQWLPNTYYAKHVEPWPEAGLRYALSYVLEYALWLYFALAAVSLLAGLRAGRAAGRDPLRRDPWLWSRLAVIATVLAHVGYYTFIIGGDHFEYRVYSHTVPLVMVSSVWMTSRLVESRLLTAPPALLLPLAVVVLSWPIPWAVWSRSQAFDTRRETLNMTVPVADVFPPGLRWYGSSFDALQRWLIPRHAIGKRHREHSFFHHFQTAACPRRRLLGPESHAEHYVLRAGAVGVPGWILARGYVIDTLGLNDYVIARNSNLRRGSRRMAHDRVPPDGYVECFRPNLAIVQDPLWDLSFDELSRHESTGFAMHVRDEPLTADAIESCERRWRERTKAGD